MKKITLIAEVLTKPYVKMISPSINLNMTNKARSFMFSLINFLEILSRLIKAITRRITLPMIPPNDTTTRGDRAFAASDLKIVETLEKNGERTAEIKP